MSTTTDSYYRARYYDPTIGRFISEDPIGFGGGLNFYRYVRNNPGNWIDPSGKIICPITDRQCRAEIAKKISDCAKNILGPYFPGLNLNTIDLVPEIPVAVSDLAPIDVGAITWNGAIYYQPGMFSGSAAGLAALGHELAHVQQQQSGLVSFLGGYLGSYLKNLIKGQNPSDAYTNIPAENQATQTENKIFVDLLNQYGMKDPCVGVCQ